jgi:hypothetical protein
VNRRHTARAARLGLLLVLVGLLGFALSACGGGDDESSDETTEQTTTEAGPPPPGTPAQAVEDFLGSVAANDRNLSWALLSKETKTTFQIDFQHWSDVLMPALRKELKPGGKAIFTHRDGDERAFLVLQGAAKGAPFPAAVRAEDGGWRLELFYPEFNPTRPAPGERVQAGENRMTLDIIRRRDQDMEVKVWLDGEPITATIETKGNFLNTYEATFDAKPGKHMLIAYATTGEGLSGGAAWEFTAR